MKILIALLIIVSPLFLFSQKKDSTLVFFDRLLNAKVEFERCNSYSKSKIEIGKAKKHYDELLHYFYRNKAFFLVELSAIEKKIDSYPIYLFAFCYAPPYLSKIPECANVTLRNAIRILKCNLHQSEDSDIVDITYDCN